MLQKIRDKSQGWFAWVVIGLIALTFILIGTGTYFSSEANNVLAKVNGQEITQADVNQYYERLLLQQGSNSSNFDAKQIKQYALEVLMQEAALKATAKEKGLRVSKDQIFQVISQDNNFYDKGEFSNEKYHQLLAQNYFTPQQYQSLIEFQFLIAQLQHGLMQTNFSLKNELNTLFKFLDQKRNFIYHVVKHEDFLKQVSVNDQEVKEYYDAHRDQFMTEEQIKIQYLELNTNDLKKEISYTESDLEQFYQDKIDLYSDPQKIKVAHILVAFDAQDAKAKEAALAKINTIKTKLSQGESFEKLAQQYSDDKLSAKNGGELSWITQGEAALIADFEKAAFAMKEVNSISEPVSTTFGYHLIKLLDQKKSKVKSFKEVKDQVIDHFTTQKAEEIILDKADKMVSEAYEHDTLEPVAEKLSLPLQTTDFIGRNGGDKGITQFPHIIKTAFSEEILEEGHNSDLLEVSQNHFVILRVAERKKAEQMPLEKVTEQIQQTLKNEKATKLAFENAKKIETQVTQSEDKNFRANLTWEESGLITRMDTSLPPQIVEKAFELPKSNYDEKQVAVVALQEGDFAVVRLQEVQDGQIAQSKADRINDMKGNLAQNYGQIDFQLFTLEAAKKAELLNENSSL